LSGDTELWNIVGMEWRDHVSWAAPILATAAAFLIAYCGPRTWHCLNRSMIAELPLAITGLTEIPDGT
jgi:hypothetical protein